MASHTNEEKKTSVSLSGCEGVSMMYYLFVKEFDNRRAIIFKRKKMNVNKELENFDHSCLLLEIKS